VRWVLVRIARCTAVWVSGQGNTDDYESYVWNGVNWQHTVRPKLILPDKPHMGGLDLSKMGRGCKIRTDLTDEDAKRIIAAFSISETDIRNYNIGLGEVRSTNPVRFEEIRDHKAQNQTSR
jgi:hypothetical protein